VPNGIEAEGASAFLWRSALVLLEQRNPSDLEALVERKR
jgi:hypothetical protein